MALLDPNSGSVVVRVIYDGPSASGKTASLNALAAQLPEHRRSEVHSFDSQTGHTLYFDLLEFDGGIVEGHQLRCQIIAVPGAPALQKRRFVLLSLADVVIFVTGTSRPELRASARNFTSLHSFLAPPQEPPVGLVIQANRRDEENALPLSEVRSNFDQGLPLIETVAPRGEGVRRAFIHAVRLGVARARRLLSTQTIPAGNSERDGGQTLVALMDDLAPFPADAENQGVMDTAQIETPLTEADKDSSPDHPSDFETQKISADQVRAIRAMPR